MPQQRQGARTLPISFSVLHSILKSPSLDSSGQRITLWEHVIPYGGQNTEQEAHCERGPRRYRRWTSPPWVNR
jgi:hypothetical protein